MGPEQLAQLFKLCCWSSESNSSSVSAISLPVLLEPLLQNNRNSWMQCKTVAETLELWPLAAIWTRLVARPQSSSYSRRSRSESRINLSSGTTCGNPNIFFVLRRQTVWRRVCRFRYLFLEFDVVGPIIYLRKVGALSRIGTLRNDISAPRSSRLFWIGVPVRHHRCSAVSPWTAWNCLVERFRISWAVRFLVSNSSQLRLRIKLSPSSRTIRNQWILASGEFPRINSDATVANVVNTISFSKLSFISSSLWRSGPRCLWKVIPLEYVCLHMLASPVLVRLKPATHVRISSIQLSIKTI